MDFKMRWQIYPNINFSIILFPRIKCKIWHSPMTQMKVKRRNLSEFLNLVDEFKNISHIFIDIPRSFIDMFQQCEAQKVK